MNTISLFTKTCMQCSQKVTRAYSTSFSSAILLLHPSLRNAIYGIYGFVRLADEIVDTFHEHDKAMLLDRFKKDTDDAIARGISLNPILQSFQEAFHKYQIDKGLVDAFFHSMEMDLEKTVYSESLELEEYIYGSAEVVGLMCLRVFCEGDKERFDQLKPFAQALGAAFQKVNFLRDIKADYQGLSRSYFPNFDFDHFDISGKQALEADIQKDFHKAYQGIRQLPPKAKLGVLVAYKYYLSLFNRIKKLPPKAILERRVRVSNFSKAMIVVGTGLRNQMNML